MPYEYATKKCPGPMDMCEGEKCAIFDKATGMCAVLAIAKALAPKPKKGGKKK